MTTPNRLPDLKPCPFCGSSTVNDTSKPDADGVWVCPDCVACGPLPQDGCSATDMWNLRADSIEAKPQGQVDLAWVRDIRNMALQGTNSLRKKTEILQLIVHECDKVLSRAEKETQK